ncbi:HDOD domain-containing protein [Methylotenera sp. L2L1]|uniref:HDOD domain-containing protein n=1 Tax=Methylotenera sp. L2L1 TaxID=1502770 RepID=UPI000564CFA2|nr:HDOD domain-containing protein [Methylotenera sp. L2L1]
MKPIEDFFNSIVSLPSLPKVVQDVMRMLNSDDVDIHMLASTIEQDAVIAAKVLKMANSSFYGVTRAVKNIDDAVAILGLAKIRSLVVACGVTGVIANVLGLDLKRFWCHSLVAASISREIAKQLGKDAEVSYLAGLLHNIGDLLIHLVFPVTSAEVDALCADVSAEARQAVEREVIGLDHCQIGEELAIRWSFPQEIARALRYYATPMDKSACEISPVVYAAVHIAQGLERGNAAGSIADSLDADIMSRLNVSGEEWLVSIERYRSFLAEANAMI